jgi:plastocyanin
MNDTMRFTPDRLSVKAGETVRFFIVNKGKLPHEMVIGTGAEIDEHAAMMKKMPGMVHKEANQITLAPGQRGGIVWQFAKAGTVSFACLPGAGPQRSRHGGNGGGQLTRLPVSVRRGGLDQRLDDGTGMRLSRCTALVEQLGQCTLHPGQVGQLRFDLRQTRGGHGLNGTAVAPIGQVEQRADFVQREAQRLRLLDEPDAPHLAGGVVAHSSSGAGHRQQSPALVIAHRFNADLSCLGQAANRQPVVCGYRLVQLMHPAQLSSPLRT